MRKFSAILSIMAVMLVVPQAFGDCNTRQSLQYTGWDYALTHLDSSTTTCWTVTDYSPDWNSSSGYWEFTNYYQEQIDRVINVPSGDSGSTDWDVLLTVDFYSPSSSNLESLSAIVDVNHGGSHTIYYPYSVIGNVTSSDSGFKFGGFSAASGDTVTVSIVGYNSHAGSGARVRFKNVWIERAE